MTFTTSRLVNSRVLVQGEDNFGVKGSVVLSSAQWDEVNSEREFTLAKGEFDKAVEEFFAPITAAAEAMKKTTVKTPDPITFLVLEEGEVGSPTKHPVVIKLDHDSVVLRILESNDHSRLAWVNDGLEILEVLPTGNGASQPGSPADVHTPVAGEADDSVESS